MQIMKLLKLLVAISWLSLSPAPWAADTVNLNTADKALLMSIKGIGARRAEQIIDYRQQNGAFESVQELTHIRGIGQAFVDRNKDVLTVVAPAAD